VSGAAVFNEEDQMKRKIDRASVIMGILLIFSLTGVKSFAIVMKNLFHIFHMQSMASI
jgi:hypothetical protein